MSDISGFYPPAPVGVPEDFTKPSKAYVWRVTFLLLGLIGFLILYLALIALTAYGIYFLVTHPPTDFIDNNAPRNRSTNRSEAAIYGIWIGAIACLGLLFIFFFKGLFKGNKPDWSHFLELKRTDQPRLFAFIDKLCEETQAPKPHKVFLSHDVNAAVIYNTSLLNLIIPPQKHLLIGAGLVESINLREFKAVLAHEFGHFSQKSLAFGNYVYLVNKILGDMIYARDGFDRFLVNWSAWDLRISFPAWGLRGILWVLRKGLGGVYKGLNLLDLSLSRQMEFNADDVAVSVAGSDPIVDVLCKVSFADECQNMALGMVMNAADHGLYTKDIHHHQTQMVAHIRKLHNDENLGIPPKPKENGHTGKDVRVFDPAKGNHGIPQMWLAHPPNHEREQNAKRIYFAVAEDTRPAWTILENTDRLKRDVSLKFFKLALGKDLESDLVDAKEVQEFIDRELAERTYDSKYETIYDNRWVGLDKLDEWETEAESSSPATESIRAFLEKYPSEQFKNLAKTWSDLVGELDLLEGLIAKKYTLKGKTLTFRGVDRKPAEFKTLLEQVNKEYGETKETLASSDRVVFLNHFQAAKELDPARAEELRDRYRFHAKLQRWASQCIGLKNSVDGAFQAMGADSQLSPEDFQHLRDLLNGSRSALLDMREATTTVNCPRLSNIEPGTTLQSLVFDGVLDLGAPLSTSGTIPGPWVGNLYQSLEKAEKRLGRIHYKSLGSILIFQEEIARDYLAKTHIEQSQNPDSTALIPDGTSPA